MARKKPNIQNTEQALTWSDLWTKLNRTKSFSLLKRHPLVLIGLIALCLLQLIVIVDTLTVLDSYKKVEATLIEYKENYDPSRTMTKLLYTPVYTYVYNGEEYLYVSNTSVGTPKREIGDEISLYIKPDDTQIVREGTLLSILLDLSTPLIIGIILLVLYLFYYFHPLNIVFRYLINRVCKLHSKSSP